MVLRFVFCSQKPLTHPDVSRSSCDIWLHWSQVLHILNNSNLRKSKRFLKNASCFWSEITSVESCAMVTSVDYPIHLGLAYLFLGGLDGFYRFSSTESCDLPLAAGRLHFQPLLPCREPAGSRRHHCHSAKKRSIFFECTTYIPFCSRSISKIFSAKSIKTDPKVESGQSELFQQKMWKITTLS